MFGRNIKYCSTPNFCRQILRYLHKQNLYQGNDNIVRSKIPSINIPNERLTDYIWAGLEKWGEKTAVVSFK